MEPEVFQVTVNAVAHGSVSMFGLLSACAFSSPQKYNCEAQPPVMQRLITI